MIVLGRAAAQTLLLCSASCSLLPVIQKDAEWGEAQVCGGAESEPGTMNECQKKKLNL